VPEEKRHGRRNPPDNSEKDFLIQAKNLKKWFLVRKGWFASLFSQRDGSYIKAVDDISFGVRKEEILGLAGESGCGKTTTGELLARLQTPTDGKILFQGKDITQLSRLEAKRVNRQIQMIFQDPYQSLNPSFTIFRTVSEPLDIAGKRNKQEKAERVLEMLERVGLRPPEKYTSLFPHQLSGGERQRVAIAQALITNPVFLVADEPISMLDVSIRAGVLYLLKSLVEEFGTSLLYISHDLSSVSHICDRICIMYLGKMVEVAPTETLIKEPAHPYTRALISAVPRLSRRRGKKDIKITGEVPSPINLPIGCRFAPRCWKCGDLCLKQEPTLKPIDSEHAVACHLQIVEDKA